MLKKVFFSVLVIFLAGCATTNVESTLHIAEDYNGIDHDKRIFLLPATTSHQLSISIGDLEQESQQIVHLISEELVAKGWQVATMSDSNFRELWSTVTAQVGGIYSSETGRIDSDKYAAAMYQLITIINKNETYAAVIQPELVIRNADLTGKHAKWDGVLVKTIDKGARARDVSWSGGTRGISLRVSAYDYSPKWLFTSYGGLALPWATIISFQDPEPEVRDDIFSDTQEVKTGISVALKPLKTKQSYREEQQTAQQ